MLVPNTLLHTRMIKEVICGFLKKVMKQQQEKIMVCFQMSSI